MTKKSFKEDSSETKYETPFKQLKIGKNNAEKNDRLQTKSGKWEINKTKNVSFDMSGTNSTADTTSHGKTKSIQAFKKKKRLNYRHRKGKKWVKKPKEKSD